MRKGKVFRIVGVGFMLLLLVSVSTYTAAGYAPPAAAGETEGTQVPEIRDIGHSYDYVESYALPHLIAGQGDGAPPRAGLSPSAIEAQPKDLDWTPVRRVAVHPSYSQILYATISNGYGLYRSTTGGQFWSRLPIGIGSGRAIVFAGDNTTALASFGDFSSGLGYYYNGGVYLSTNTGNTWTDVSTGIDYTVVAAAFDPGNVSRIYAATLGGGVYRTENGGGTWTQINTGLAETWIFSIAASPSSSGVLYAGGMEQVYYSSDYGNTWTIADNTYSGDHFYNEAVAVDPGNANTYYVGSRRLAWWAPDGLTEGGFFKSTVGPGDGNLILKNSGMQDTFVLDITRDPLNSSILYAGTWGSGVFRSDDGGVTWLPKNAGLEVQYIYGIEAVADGGSPSGVTLYVATFYNDHGIYKSTDRGETWTDPWGGTFPPMFDVTTAVAPDWVAAATSEGVIFSDDGGVNWWYSADLTGGEPGIVLDLARDPGTSSRLLAATYGGGIWTSEDAGISWSEASTGIGDGSYIFDIIFSPNDASTAYAGSHGVYTGAFSGGSWSWSALGSLGEWVRAVDAEGAGLPDVYAGTYEDGVYTSYDANGTWSATNSGLGDLRIRSLKAVGSSQLFAGTNGSSAWEYTFTSRQSGEEPADPEGSGIWTKVGPTITAPGVIQIAIHPTNSAIIYAATDQGVYRSTDSGETWMPRNKGLGGYGDLVVSGISIDRNNPEIVYLGTWGYGVFKWDIPQQKWVRLSDPLKSSTIYLPLVLRNHVTSYEQVVLYEGFEGTFPGAWTIGDDNSSDGLYYWGKRNCRPYAGGYSGWAAGAGSTYLSCGSDYRNNMGAWMIRGPFSLADASGAELTFKLWLNAESGYDALCRYASTDGTNFSGSCTTGNSAGWIDRVLDLGGYAGQPNVWIALFFGSDGSITYPEGAHVDNIEVRKWVGTRAVPDADAPVSVPDTVHDEPSTWSIP